MRRVEESCGLASRTSAEEHEDTGYHSHSGCGQRHHSERNDLRKRADEKKHPITSSPYSFHLSISTPRHHAIMLHGSAMFG